MQEALREPIMENSIANSQFHLSRRMSRSEWGQLQRVYEGFWHITAKKIDVSDDLS